MKNQTEIKPIAGNVLLKGISTVSILELTNKNLPPLQWILYLEDIGSECPQLESYKDKTVIVTLDDKNRVKQISSSNNLYSLHLQYELIKTNKLQIKDKIEIVEYFITPIYNIIAIQDYPEQIISNTVYNYLPKE